jgi:hypothetical protein
VGNYPGGRPEDVQPEKTRKIPEVVKVNNYQNVSYSIYLTYVSRIYSDMIHLFLVR